jgi:hypothetical protein
VRERKRGRVFGEGEMGSFERGERERERTKLNKRLER